VTAASAGAAAVIVHRNPDKLVAPRRSMLGAISLMTNE
jgi:hypothetical protein